MSTDLTMDTSENNGPSVQCSRSAEDNHTLLAHANCSRALCLQRNSQDASTSVCSRSSDLLDDDDTSYEEYEAGMLRACHFRSDDEMPIFRIQSLSPTSRSLSPIELDDDDELLTFSLSPCGSTSDLADSPSHASRQDIDGTQDDSADDRISVDSINALLGTPPASSQLGKRLNLETIFEGVFLHTPPQKCSRVKDFVEDQRKQRRLDLSEMDDEDEFSCAATSTEPVDSESLLF